MYRDLQVATSQCNFGCNDLYYRAYPHSTHVEAQHHLQLFAHQYLLCNHKPEVYSRPSDAELCMSHFLM